MSAPEAIVVGGGLAGIAASLRLADRGVRVTLLEASRRLGGRATSHIDPQSGEELDNCQHVTMGACTEYNALLDRLGMGSVFEWSHTQTWIETGGRTSTIQPGALPAPLHLAGSFAAARFLSFLDKVAIAAAMPTIALARRQAWRDRTFLEFLRHAAQPETTIERFWAPVVVSACNLDVSRVSAGPALMVFQNALFAGSRAARIGVPRVPLGRLYESVGPLLTRAGGRVVLGQRAESIVELAGGVSVRARDGAGGPGAFDATMAVVALPPHRVGAVLPSELRALVPMLDRVEHSPIIGVHLRADRPVLSPPHAVLVERQTQWLFRKNDAGTSVHAVVSAAPASLMSQSEAQIAACAWSDLVACVPGAADARLVWSRVIKNRLATFAATPAFEAARPAPGPLRARSRIALAGDYTQTGWPATMEGATRSGRMAADALLG